MEENRVLNAGMDILISEREHLLEEIVDMSRELEDVIDDRNGDLREAEEVIDELLIAIGEAGYRWDKDVNEKTILVPR
jgi:hypothetical protein